MPNMRKKTRTMLGETGATYGQLVGWLRCGRLPPPQKDVSGDFLWSGSDVARVRALVEAAKQRKQRKQAAAG
jgi:hypothetical protein